MAETEAEQSKISPSEFMDKIGSLAAGVFILYLMVSFNFIPEIFGCHLQNMLKNNYMAKHVVGVMTVFFFINVTTTTLPWHLGIKFAFSLILYMLFVFSNKSEYATQIGFMVIIFISYIMQLVRDQWTKYAQENKNLTPAEVDDLKNKSVVLGKAQLGLLGIGLLVIIVGHIAYIGKKKMEFKGRFSYWEMLKGSSGCKGTDRRPYTIKEALSEGLRIFDSPQEVAARETERLRKISDLFDPTNEVDLKVPSGLSLRAPTNKELAQAGERVGLSLSNLGQLVLQEKDNANLLPSFVPPNNKF